MNYCKKLTIMATLLFSAFCLENVSAQRASIRNNLLYDATLTPNLGFDVRVDSLLTLGATVGINAWDIDKDKNKKWRHLLVEANMRRWLGDSVYHKSYVEACRAPGASRPRPEWPSAMRGSRSTSVPPAVSSSVTATASSSCPS